MLGYGDSCCAGAVHNHLDFVDFFICDFERVQKSRCHNDSRAVLIVVKNGYIALFLKLSFYLKAARSGNILKVYTAEGAAYQINGVDNLINILALYADGKSINVAEGLEQRTLAFHNGHTCLWADVTKAEDRRAVGDDRNKVVSAGKLIAFVYVLLNLKAGLGNAGGVGERQILRG